MQEFDNVTLSSHTEVPSSITDTSTTLAGNKSVRAFHLSLLDKKLKKMVYKQEDSFLKPKQDDLTLQKVPALILLKNCYFQDPNPDSQTRNEVSK